MPADPAAAEALLAAGAPVEALVPADIGGLRAAAEVLRSSADVLETGGAALIRIEVTHWRGEASMAFSDRISVEPGRWRSASDALAAGASALDRYADDVGAARSTAAQAVEVYQEYCSAVTKVAVAGGVRGPLVGGPMSVGMRVGEPIGSGSRRSSVICASTRSDGSRHRDLGARQSAFGVVMTASSAL